MVSSSRKKKKHKLRGNEQVSKSAVAGTSKKNREVY